MMRFEYFYGLQAEQYSFYRIPKILFQAECFRSMSCESKVLYGLMLDRMDLSIKNRWFDEDNRVFIIFSIDEVMEKLCCAKQKAVKLVAELAEIGLIEKKRIGFGKANIIYVKNFAAGQGENGVKMENYGNQTSKSMKSIPQEVLKSNSQKCGNQTSRSTENIPQEVSKSNFQRFENQTLGGMRTELQEVCFPSPNQTEYNKPEINKNQSYQSARGKLEAIEAYREIIHDNIEYEILCSQYTRERVDEIVALMLEVVTSGKRSYRIAGVETEASIVKSKFMQIGNSHIHYVFMCLDENTSKVTNIKQYLLTVLYNSTMTMDHYYRSKVQHDMFGS